MISGKSSPFSKPESPHPQYKKARLNVLCIPALTSYDSMKVLMKGEKDRDRQREQKTDRDRDRGRELLPNTSKLWHLCVPR